MEEFMLKMCERLRRRAEHLEHPPATEEDKAVARALREMADAIEEGIH